jgi:FkbM family methyltransferase
VKFKAGVAFPDADEFMVSELRDDGTYQQSHLDAALRYVTDFRCAIDGGAHVGSWSRLMARVFDRVIAVEPSADTCECLALNVHAWPRVEVRAVALGASTGSVGLALDEVNARRGNTGARHVTAAGGIPVETIDVVLFENKHLWSRYFGIPRDAVERLLTGHGYRLREIVSCDQIWSPA